MYGHTQQIQFIREALHNKKHHALLLSGPQGIGKASIAKALSIEALQQSSPFSAQIIEKQCSAGAYPNYHYLTPDPTESKSEIYIEQIRRLISDLRHKAAIPGLRIVLIDTIDQFNRNAANALLKILEEPPSDTIFILISHQIATVLSTIRSRCVVVPFMALANHLIKEILQSLEITIQEEILPYCLGSIDWYLKIEQAGGASFLTTLEQLSNNLPDLKLQIQNLLKTNVSDDFIIKTLHRLFYVKSLCQPKLALITQNLDRFIRQTNHSHLDPVHRILAAIMLVS